MIIYCNKFNNSPFVLKIYISCENFYCWFSATPELQNMKVCPSFQILQKANKLRSLMIFKNLYGIKQH